MVFINIILSTFIIVKTELCPYTRGYKNALNSIQFNSKQKYKIQKIKDRRRKSGKIKKVEKTKKIKIKEK